MRFRLAVACLLASLFALASAPARAQCPTGPDVPTDQCFSGDVDFVHRAAAIPSISLDSGWVPAGSPIQVHFAFLAMAESEVEMGGSVVTSWPTTPPMRAVQVAVPGRPDAGRLAMAYGFEIVAEIRLHLEVGGATYDFTGDIPLPGSFPRDLRLAAETTFDPFVLTGATPRPITVMDSTSPVRVVGISISSLAGVSIPGIDGGIDLTAVASLSTSYQSDRIDIANSPSFISNEGGVVPLPPMNRTLGFGPSVDVTVLPHGHLYYDGVVTMTPAVYVTLAGRRWDLASFSLPLHVVQTESETSFQEQTVHVPLPDVALDPDTLELGDVEIGQEASDMAVVRNDGEADLVVHVVPPGGAMTVAPSDMRLPPHSSRALLVTYTPTDVEDVDALVTLTTNDPDTAALALHVHASSHAAPIADAGPPPADASPAGDGGHRAGPSTAGGCGCSVEARPAPSWLLAGIALLFVVRRRRR
ncbi:MAG: MYXO-CTERM sorting domain-containing protein [Sandaracinus sp.]